MGALNKLENDLADHQKKLVAECNFLLKNTEKDIKALLANLDINSLEHLVSSQVSTNVTHHIRVPHPQRERAFKVDAVQLKENYLAIFNDGDRSTIKKYDRLLRMKFCLAKAGDLQTLTNGLKAVFGSETAKQELLFTTRNRAMNFTTPEAQFVALVDKFLLVASLQEAKLSRRP